MNHPALLHSVSLREQITDRLLRILGTYVLGFTGLIFLLTLASVSYFHRSELQQYRALIDPEEGRNWGGTLLEPMVGVHPAVYFVHSFSAVPEVTSDRLADCLYGGHRICAAVQRENLMASQFHPERSGAAGLALIRQFLHL